MNLGAFAADVEEAPQRLRELAQLLEEADPWAAVRAGSYQAVLLAGMGSSGYAARTVAGWLRDRGVPAVDEPASARLGLRGGSGTLAVLVSATGGSAETLACRERLAVGTTTVALTNRPDSPLASACDHVVAMAAGPERSGVACRTFRHTVAILAVLGLGRTRVATAVREAAATTAALLADRSWLAELRRVLDGAPATWWLAPAEMLAAAQQCALMQREVPRLLATGCETGDWSHVDVYLAATTDYRAIVLTGSDWDEPAAAWLSRRGSTVISLGPEALGVPGEHHVLLPADPLVRLLVAPLIGELVADAAYHASPPLIAESN